MAYDADATPGGLVSFDEDAVVLGCNRTLLAWLGRERPDVVGRRLDEVLTVAGRLFFQTHLFPLLKLRGGAEELALSLRTADGTPCPVLASAARVSEEPARYELACLRVPRRRRYEDEILGARREAERALRSNEALVAAREEAETHALDLDRQLRRARRLRQETGRVAAVLSHQLREPIRKTRMFASLARETLGPPTGGAPEAVEALDAIEREADRIDALVGTLRDFLQVDDEPRLGPVRLDDVVRDARARIRERRGRAPEVEHAPLPEVQGDARALVRLFEQLFDNSVRYVRAGEAPVVRITARTARENVFAALPGRFRYVAFALLGYEDNTVGFEPRHAARVFDLLPRVTPASGYGVGLALCRKIAESHDGEIRMVVADAGTRFEIKLPIARVPGSD